MYTEPLSNEQIQVILTGKFGDGCLCTNGQARLQNKTRYNYYYSTSCIYKDYLNYKAELLGNLVRCDIRDVTNAGYKKNVISRLSTLCHPQITEIYKESLSDSLMRMDGLGLSLWFYDDGSLHRVKHFYNLNTQAFSREENNDILVPFLKNRFDITATPTIERKTDGREYWYLRIKKYQGAFIISEILKEYFVPCFAYKIIDDGVMKKWSILRNNARELDIDLQTIHPKTLCSLLNRIQL